MLTRDQWLQRCIGAYAELCGDEDEALAAVNDAFEESEIDTENDCPIQSAREIYEDSLKEVA